MSGPIVRSGPTEKFTNNWDRVFGGKTSATEKAAASKKKAVKSAKPAKAAKKAKPAKKAKR